MKLAKTARTVLVGFIGVALCVSATMGPAAADARDDKARVDKKIENLMRDFEGLSKDLATAKAQLEDAEERLPGAKEALGAAKADLADAEEKDAILAQRLGSAEAAERKISKELKSGKANIEANQENVSKIARRAYQNGGVSSNMAIMLQAAQGDDVVSGVSMVSSAVRSQNRVIAKLTEQRAVNRNNQARLDAIAVEIGELKKESEENVRVKETAQAAAAEEQAKVENIISTQTTASKKLSDSKAQTESDLAAEKQEQDRLAKEVDELIKKEEAEARKRAKENQNNNSNDGGGGGGNDNGGGGGGGTFSNPANGYPITSSFGYRIHPITGSKRLHTGTDFGVPCGTPIRAAASGRVVSAGWGGGYGNRVVISHGSIKGSRIATTYNHNIKVNVSAGQKVRKGQIVSISGTTGSSTGCHLHFEVMRNGGYVNPMGYL
ncbi:peptidoglycan DD-metalloendopeptidase family protein [Saxibacter everestensis]|uniref:Peptidoglycan DD-metalloendopeptidase family protein n=1 Tax=Saxibacter everestensis TaxID=2909229 RepID=A0ABY8QQW9_9MICO|nr:peptidoglycan DD-metalloendopeptidase family protein [Brevibacteriaceae bacterium ZFBP1038]